MALGIATAPPACKAHHGPWRAVRRARKRVHGGKRATTGAATGRRFSCHRVVVSFCYIGGVVVRGFVACEDWGVG